MSDVLATNAELEALRKDAGIPHLPTQLTFEARLAICGEGPRAYDWADKPHRVVYDLCREIEKNAALPAVQPDAAALIRWHDMLLRDFGDDLSSIVRAEMLALIDKPGKEVDDER